MTGDQPASEADERLAWVERVARFGWLAKGFVFVVIGVLAIQLAVRSWEAATDETNQSGALRTIAAQPLGGVVVGVVAVGLAFFLVWNVAQAVVPGSVESGALGLAKRAGWFGLGLFYGTLAAAAAGLALRSVEDSDPAVSTSSAEGTTGGTTGSADIPTSPQALTARLLDHTGGRWLVAVVGVVVLVVAAYHLRKGLTHDFVDDIDTHDLSGRQQRWLGWFGAGGFVARALVLGVVGWFLLSSAVTYDADDAVGLDGALRELAQLTYGRVLLFAVALGLVVAGLYDMVTFRRQEVR